LIELLNLKGEISMGDIQICFQDWYLKFPDNDESLLDQTTDDGKQYLNETVNLMWFAFKAGYCYAE